MKQKQIWFAALALLVMMSMIPFSVWAESIDEDCTNGICDCEAVVGETHCATLDEAIQYTNNHQGGIITLRKNVIYTGGAISYDTTITGLHTITRSGSQTGTLFTVESGAKLTLENLTIDANNNWSFDDAAYNEALQNGAAGYIFNNFVKSEAGAPNATSVLINIKESCHVEMKNSTIKNFFSNIDNGNPYENRNGVGVFSVGKNATLTMHGANIFHCATNGSACVAKITSGTMYLEEGTVISNNFAGENGGMAHVTSNGEVYMNGGRLLITKPSIAMVFLLCCMRLIHILR